MHVTAYNDTKNNTADGSRPGPGTVAVAQNPFQPFPFGSSVKVYNSDGTVAYQGVVHDKGNGNIVNNRNWEVDD
jgi:3D (Asp-Asp-Asp) domain-containing protein